MNALLKQYVAYYRLSTRAQAESSLGWENQRNIVRQHCQGKVILDEIMEIWPGQLGDLSPGLRKAIAQCKETGATLVVAQLDRLGRVKHQLIDVYDELNGDLEACDTPDLKEFISKNKPL